MRYFAIIHKEPNTEYGVSFPDFPGCISSGDTLDEALLNAKEALIGHVKFMQSDLDSIPTPSTLDDVADQVKKLGEDDDFCGIFVINT